MPDSPASLTRKIGSAGDLRSVVRAMRAQAAASVGQYEQSLTALNAYAETVELGLGACLRDGRSMVPDGHERVRNPALDSAMNPALNPALNPVIRAVVFGSDQGLVGRFNDVVLAEARNVLSAALTRVPTRVHFWVVGERLLNGITASGLSLFGVLPVPQSVRQIAHLVGQILVEYEAGQRPGESAELYLFHNRPSSAGSYQSVSQRLLPLDQHWQRQMVARRWPTSALPEVLGDADATLRALLREYLFIAIFRACAESLASENASRLAAMDRADRNIEKILVALRDDFHRLRQSAIDEELADVVAGFKGRVTSWQ